MGDIEAFAHAFAAETGQPRGQQGWDLIFSHAALHWVADHGTLIPRLLSLLAPGGQLAVQAPSNHGHPSQALILELAGEEPFRSALDGWRRVSPVLTIRQYAELLFAYGATDIVVFEKVYPHVLENADAVADWVSGTALVPYFPARRAPPVRSRSRSVSRFRTRAIPSRTKPIAKFAQIQGRSRAAKAKPEKSWRMRLRSPNPNRNARVA
jgi:trans-aconitate 2-methyltransferase